MIHAPQSKKSAQAQEHFRQQTFFSMALEALKFPNPQETTDALKSLISLGFDAQHCSRDPDRETSQAHFVFHAILGHGNYHLPNALRGALPAFAPDAIEKPSLGGLNPLAFAVSEGKFGALSALADAGARWDRPLSFEALRHGEYSRRRGHFVSDELQRGAGSFIAQAPCPMAAYCADFASFALRGWEEKRADSFTQALCVLEKGLAAPYWNFKPNDPRLEVFCLLAFRSLGSAQETTSAQMVSLLQTFQKAGLADLSFNVLGRERGEAAQGALHSAHGAKPAWDSWVLARESLFDFAVEMFGCAKPAALSALEKLGAAKPALKSAPGESELDKIPKRKTSKARAAPVVFSHDPAFLLFSALSWSAPDSGNDEDERARSQKHAERPAFIQGAKKIISFSKANFFSERKGNADSESGFILPRHSLLSHAFFLSLISKSLSPSFCSLLPAFEQGKLSKEEALRQARLLALSALEACPRLGAQDDDPGATKVPRASAFPRALAASGFALNAEAIFSMKAFSAASGAELWAAMTEAFILGTHQNTPLTRFFSCAKDGAQAAKKARMLLLMAQSAGKEISRLTPLFAELFSPSSDAASPKNLWGAREAELLALSRSFVQCGALLPKDALSFLAQAKKSWSFTPQAKTAFEALELECATGPGRKTSLKTARV